MNQSPQLSINSKQCIKCGACVRACPTKVIELTPTGAAEKYPLHCISCGHCVAVCPVDAIRHLSMGGDFLAAEKSSISFEQFAQLTRNRRSIRNFTPQPVDKSTIEKILDSAKYAPTGSNAQELQYLVISEAARLNLIRNAFVKLFDSRTLRLIYRLFFGKEKARVRQFFSQRTAQGDDLLLRNAPVLIIIHVKKKTTMSNLDAGIAGHHINLACETLGLGACWVGIHTVFCRLFKSMKTVSLIPAGHKIVGSVVIGYPAIKYHKTCARKPVIISWEG